MAAVWRPGAVAVAAVGTASVSRQPVVSLPPAAGTLGNEMLEKRREKTALVEIVETAEVLQALIWEQC